MSNQSRADARRVDPKQQAAVPLFSWGGLLSPLFCLLLLAAVVIALLPDSVVGASEVAQRYSTIVRSTLLLISRYADINAHAQSTAFPHAALLSHAWLWTSIGALLIFNTIASLINWRHWMGWFQTHRGPATKLKRRDIVVGVVILLLGSPVFSMLPGSSIVGSAELTSRLFFAFLTAAFLFLWQLLTYGWLPCLITDSKSA